MCPLEAQAFSFLLCQVKWGSGCGGKPPETRTSLDPMSMENKLAVPREAPDGTPAPLSTLFAYDCELSWSRRQAIDGHGLWGGVGGQDGEAALGLGRGGD